MKKKGLILFVVVCILATTAGCKIRQIELTDNERQEIAEYTAHLLLKHDRNYSPTLMYREDFNKELEKRIAEAEAANPTPTPTEEPTEDPEASKQESKGSDAESEPEQKEEYVGLGELYGLKKIKVDFDNVAILDEFTSDTEYFTISAPEGQKIVAVNFSFTNGKDKERKLETGSLSVVYTLETESGKRFEAKTSLLENDIQFLNTRLAAGEKKSAVLLFFVDSAETEKSLNLYLKRGEHQSKLIVK